MKNLASSWISTRNRIRKNTQDRPPEVKAPLVTIEQRDINQILQQVFPRGTPVLHRLADDGDIVFFAGCTTFLAQDMLSHVRLFWTPGFDLKVDMDAMSKMTNLGQMEYCDIRCIEDAIGWLSDIRVRMEEAAMEVLRENFDPRCFSAESNGIRAALQALSCFTDAVSVIDGLMDMNLDFQVIDHSDQGLLGSWECHLEIVDKDGNEGYFNGVSTSNLDCLSVEFTFPLQPTIDSGVWKIKQKTPKEALETVRAQYIMTALARASIKNDVTLP